MLEGTMVALITPMKNGRVDERSLRRLVRFHEENGTDVLVPCGTTGESATLTHEEHENVIEIVVDEAEDIEVMPGTGSNSTHEALRFTEHARDVGCEHALVITPYYNNPPQRGLIQHFRSLADSVEINLVLYNVPSRTGVNLEPETVETLADHRNIAGLKEASGDINQISRICQNTPDDFAVLSGDDSMTLPLLSVGGHGVVSVVGNLVPDEMSKLVSAWKKNNPVTARQQHQKLLPLMEAMFWETNPIPVKAAANLMDLCGPEIRSPMIPLQESLREPLGSILTDLGVNVSND